VAARGPGGSACNGERSATGLPQFAQNKSPVQTAAPQCESRREGAVRIEGKADEAGVCTSGRMDTAFEELEAAGWCRAAPQRAGDQSGRQRKDWAINPALRGSVE